MPSCFSTFLCASYHTLLRASSYLTHHHSQESYRTPDTDPRTGQLLDFGTSDLKSPGLAKKGDGFLKKGLLRALETQHRGAGGIPEVKVVGNGHCHGNLNYPIV